MEKPNVAHGAALSLASVGLAVEVFGWSERHHELARGACAARARPRAPARAGHPRADRDPARGRRRGAAGDPARRRGTGRSLRVTRRIGHSGAGRHCRHWGGGHGQDRADLRVRGAQADPAAVGPDPGGSDAGLDHRQDPGTGRPVGQRPDAGLHGRDRLRPVADAEDDAQDQAGADQADGDAGDQLGEIAGVDEAKAELEEVVEFLSDPKRFVRSARRCPRACCCTGLPGRARRCWPRRSPASPARSSSASRGLGFVEMFAGLGAARIRRLFAEARKNAPAILFIDELDAVGARRGTDNNSEREQTLNQLLVEMDGFGGLGERHRHRRLQPAREARPGAAAPRPLRPPGLRLAARRGRAPARSSSVHTRDKPLGDDVDLDLVAAQTSGLTGADLANICNEAAIFCARRERRRRSRSATSRMRWSASSRACSPPRRSTPTSAGSSPTTRPATRSAASCWPPPTASTRSRSSRAARRSAT